MDIITFTNVRNKFDCASKSLGNLMTAWMFNSEHGAVQTVKDALRNVGFDDKTRGWVPHCGVGCVTVILIHDISNV